MPFESIKVARVHMSSMYIRHRYEVGRNDANLASATDQPSHQFIRPAITRTLRQDRLTLTSSINVFNVNVVIISIITLLLLL